MRKRVLCHMRTTKAQICLRSLIIAFVFSFLDRVMSLVSVTKNSSIMLTSVAEQASLSLTWSETPEDTFSYDEAHMYFYFYSNFSDLFEQCGPFHGALDIGAKHMSRLVKKKQQNGMCAKQRLRSAWGGARWLSGRVSDSGARGRGFDTYRRRVVSLSKTLYSPKVLVNYPGSGGSVPT